LNGLAQLELGGRKDPHVSTITKIALALGHPPDFFLREDEPHSGQKLGGEVVGGLPKIEAPDGERSALAEISRLVHEGEIQLMLSMPGQGHLDYVGPGILTEGQAYTLLQERGGNTPARAGFCERFEDDRSRVPLYVVAEPIGEIRENS